MKKTLFLLFALFFAPKLPAQQIRYEVSAQVPAAQMLGFTIPYTFGVHKGEVHSISGYAITTGSDEVVSARFEVPIDSIRTGNTERDCHLREAVGIDYTNSRFPKEHVCDGNHQIPANGPDAVHYPLITVEFIGMSIPSEPFTIGTPQNFAVQGKIKIHGVEKIQTWPVMITKTVSANGAQGFRLVSRFEESLKDFGIQVKPFMGIGVKDTVTVSTDLALVRQR